MTKWIKDISRPFREYQLNKKSSIRFWNFWDGHHLTDLWFYRFVKHHKIVEKSGLKGIDFFSVFGPRALTQALRRKETLSVFFTGENVENFPSYDDHMLGDVDLSIGFEYLNDPKYLRFPLWILYIIEPEWSKDQIADYIDQKFIRPIQSKREKFCCLVSSHDRNGIRLKIKQAIELFGPVDSGGRMYNNTDELVVKFGNDKIRFIQNYQLNICPENSNTRGYITEKLFQSLLAGCIPVYWGDNNFPEPDVIHQGSLLFFDEDGANDHFFRTLKTVRKSSEYYEQWCSQPRLKSNSVDVIWNHIKILENKLLNK